MKSVNKSILRSVFAVVLGLMLVLWPDNALDILVIAMGALFLAAGVVTIAAYFARDKSLYPNVRFPIEGAGSFLLGLLLVVAPKFFVGILMIVLGIVLAIAGLQQIAMLFSARKWTEVSIYFYIVPVLVTVCGIIVLFNAQAVAQSILILSGVTCIVYGIAGLVNELRFRKQTN